MGVIAGTRDLYNYIMENKSDGRTTPWLLMSNPWPTASIVLAYLVFVKVAPRYMARREAYDLRLVLVCYNLTMVIISGYNLHEFVVSTVLQPGFDVRCEPVDYSNNPHAVRLAGAVWWFFLSKIIELLDTVFFILRKKNKQVTFLHVYHHTTMVMLWWGGTKFVAGGESFFSAMINSFIHILMYTYYLLSSCGPRVRKFLWWKRYLTRLQLTQFFVITIQTLYARYIDCGFPTSYLYALVAYMISHIILFGNFYHKAYIVNERHDKQNGAPYSDRHDVAITNGKKQQ